MVLSVSLVVLLGLLVWFLIRYANLATWHAAVCVLFGFWLASTGLAPYIRQASQAVARWIGGIDT